MYERIEVIDHVTIMNKALYDNLQDGIDESKKSVSDLQEVVEENSTATTETLEKIGQDMSDFKTSVAEDLTEFGNSIEKDFSNLENSVRDLEKASSSVLDLDKTTVFNEDGSIVETTKVYKTTTVFKEDGSIVETKEFNDGSSDIIVKTTTFNEDGSISEVFK